MNSLAAAMVPARAQLQAAPRPAAQASQPRAPLRPRALSAALCSTSGAALAAGSRSRRRAPLVAAAGPGPGAGASGGSEEAAVEEEEEDVLDESFSALAEADGNATEAGARMLDPAKTEFMDAPVKNSSVRSALDDIDSLARSEMEVLNKAYALLEGFGVKMTTKDLVVEDNRLTAEDLTADDGDK